MSVLLLAAALLGTAACGSKSQADDGEEGEKKVDAVPVEVITLGRGPIEQILRFSTHLEAERAVEVRAEAARKIVQLLVEEGHQVGRGQPLARLEDDQQRVAVERSESQVAQAQREHDRLANLFEQRMISDKEMTQARYELEQRQLALADARRELSYTVIRAPLAGTVTGRHVRVGDTVSPNQHLFDIVDYDSLVALVYVPEKDLGQVSPEQPARLVPPAAPERSFAGRIDRVAPVVDPKSGTVKVTVRVPYEEGLRPGMFLEVELVTAIEPSALLVPKKALVPDGTRLAVWKLGGDLTVERIWVDPVLEDRVQVTVVDGLAEGDRVVIAGQAGLKPGAKVELVGAVGDPG